MFAVAGVLVIGAAVALWQAVDAVRWREFRRFWIALVCDPPSLCRRWRGSVGWQPQSNLQLLGQPRPGAELGMRKSPGALERLPVRADQRHHFQGNRPNLNKYQARIPGACGTCLKRIIPPLTCLAVRESRVARTEWGDNERGRHGAGYSHSGMGGSSGFRHD